MILPRDVLASVNSQFKKEVSKSLERLTRERFEVIKLDMIKSFEQHPITQEIEGGPNASNSSRTLSGYGNLFTFIGFPSGFDPLGPIRERLEEVTLTRLVIRKKSIDFMTNEPTREELFKITKFSSFRNDVEGTRSWLDGIETGISGLGYYLYKMGKDIKGSRSGPAIQLTGGKKSDSAFGGGSTGGAIDNQRTRYTRTSYISKILKGKIIFLSKCFD